MEPTDIKKCLKNSTIRNSRVRSKKFQVDAPKIKQDWEFYALWAVSNELRLKR